MKLETYIDIRFEMNTYVGWKTILIRNTGLKDNPIVAAHLVTNHTEK